MKNVEISGVSFSFQHFQQVFGVFPLISRSSKEFHGFALWFATSISPVFPQNLPFLNFLCFIPFILQLSPMSEKRSVEVFFLLFLFSFFFYYNFISFENVNGKEKTKCFMLNPEWRKKENSEFRFWNSGFDLNTKRYKKRKEDIKWFYKTSYKIAPLVEYEGFSLVRCVVRGDCRTANGWCEAPHRAVLCALARLNWTVSFEIENNTEREKKLTGERENDRTRQRTAGVGRRGHHNGREHSHHSKLWTVPRNVSGPSGPNDRNG